MSHRTLPLFAAPALLLLLAATPAGNEHAPKMIATSNNAFAFELFRQLNAEIDDNVFISPFSISTALAMTYAGANGSNALEMAKILHFADNAEAFHIDYGHYLKSLEASAKDNIELRIANRLWGEMEYELLPSFTALNAKAYQSPLQPMNFRHQPNASRIQINDWVARKTKNRITDLIPEGAVTEDTRLVLTNAIYFKGDWHYEFDEKDTRDRTFFPKGKAPIQTPFMHSRNTHHYAQAATHQMISLPYKGNKQSMVLVLPSGTDQLLEVASEINTESFDKLFNSRQSEVILALPKFKMTLPLTLKDHLKKMGMEEAFTPQANFSKMSPYNDLYISEVIHKAFIEIDEKGTEAAAATAVVMMMTSSAYSEPKTPIYFTADRPFLFYIIDNDTKAILFMGKVMSPSA